MAEVSRRIDEPEDTGLISVAILRAEAQRIRTFEDVERVFGKGATDRLTPVAADVVRMRGKGPKNRFGTVRGPGRRF